MAIKPLLLWSDVLLLILLLACAVGVWFGSRSEPVRAAWRAVGASPRGMAAATVLAAFLAVGIIDSLHYRERLPGAQEAYAVEVVSALDALLLPLKEHAEKTYSAPLAIRSFAKESGAADGGRDFPRLRYGGAQLGASAQGYAMDIIGRIAVGLLGGGLLWLMAAAWIRYRGRPRWPWLAWRAVLATLLPLLLLGGVACALAGGYHVLGTDKVGQDVLYLALKSIRTGLLIGTLTTLIMLPAALLLGIVAGYLGGWADDAIQYLYTVLNSIPGVLLIAAAVLMMQVVIDTHAQWFATAAERADARLLALCLILGVTSWTGLCRLLRGETLKLRELDYVLAARAFGVSAWRIMARHLLPNLMHIVLISVVMDFSGLVLAEAVLSYIGIGVDPGMISFGTMINAARLELAREPMVWWSLVTAFGFMFALVLAANLFADVVQDAFDPRRRKQ